MLTKQEVAYRLVAAMDGRDPPIPSAWLARRCGVTPQAVYKWRTKGEIDLIEHIHAIAEATKVPAEFFIEKRRGESKETSAIWKSLGHWASKAALVLLFVGACLGGDPADAAVLHSADCAVHYCAKYFTEIHIALLSLLRRAKVWIASLFRRIPYSAIT